MRWIKRNLFLLIGIVVAIGLMAGAVVYLISKIKADQKASKDLKTKQADLITLKQYAPYPEQANLDLAQGEALRLAQYVTNVQAHFTYPDVSKMTSQEFSSLLLNSIAELQKGAEQAGVQLPSLRYGFSYEPLVQQVNFDAASIEPLSRQLMETKLICGALYESRIHKLESFKRVRVSVLDPAQGPQYLDKAINPAAYNGIATVTPYELVFIGFATELAAVVEKLQRSKVFFAVKIVSLDTLKTGPGAAAPAPAPAPSATSTNSAAGGAAAKTKAKAPEPVAAKDELYLFEQPLRVQLFVEVIRLNPAAR
jgi:hypothetical protein